MWYVNITCVITLIIVYAVPCTNRDCHCATNTSICTQCVDGFSISSNGQCIQNTSTPITKTSSSSAPICEFTFTYNVHSYIY